MRASASRCFVLALLVVSCKRSPAPAASVDAGAAALGGGDAGAASWDGPFGATRAESAKGIALAVAGAATPSLGIVMLDAKGAERSRRAAVQLAAPLHATPAIVAFAAGGTALVYSARTGEPQVAIMVGATGEPASPPSVVGADYCGTDDALWFLEKSSRRLRRWDRGAREPRAADGPAFADHATPLCGAHAAFVLEPKSSGFDVVATSGFARAHVAEGVDPQNAGSYAAYVTNDGVGLVHVQSSGALTWTTIGADAKATARTLKRKVGAEQTIVAADGAADRLAVLLQHDDKKRCGEDETPPAYDVLEVSGADAGASASEKMSSLPPAACESEASPPDVQLTKAGAIVRWFEWKEGSHEKRLVFWAHGTPGDRRVPDDTFLLDCEDDCLAVGREGNAFRVISVP